MGDQSPTKAAVYVDICIRSPLARREFSPCDTRALVTVIAFSFPDGVNPAAVAFIGSAAIVALLASQILPVVIGLPARWWQRWYELRSRRPSDEVTDVPLRQDLTAAATLFATATRMLLSQLSHAQTRASEWHDGKRPGLAARCLGFRNDEDYQPTIALFGEVSRWLQHASLLVSDDGPDGPAIRETCARVRGLVLADNELASRINGIAAAIRELDARFSALGSSPYRDHRRPAAPAIGLQTRADDDDDDARSRARLLADHEDMFRSVAARYADDESGREDLLQDIRIAVWVALPRHRGDASLATYIRRIAHYCGARFGRRQFKIESIDEPMDRAPSVLERLEDAERLAALRTALSTLSSKQREAIDLLLSGSSYREVADHLGISESNASVRITRARKQLRKQLVPVFGILGGPA